MTSSGRMQDSSMGTPSRTLRYSGRERPAWRMNHTGVCGTGSRLHALRKALSYVAVGCGVSLAVTRPVSHAAGSAPEGVLPCAAPRFPLLFPAWLRLTDEGRTALMERAK
ncbi:hypothetical protein GCM10018980_45690 [Streptomyces capoamus]|uniref:Uncharacterized protein n=1 Tax=Streptomyces capoamus TaxID=68183 RepID=A0A919EY81_9ACTN|nr:hypothetical protein GCM10010501_62610 [Streptomyces libani subsp. rufus]GHG58422.1 hypothetical protein GCM10018980_45690 [Streptomyces capoamus]